MTVTETTTPAMLDSGMRAFSVRLHEFHEVDLIVTHRRDDGRHYDEPVLLIDAAEPVNNTDLTTALIQLASRAVSVPGSGL